MENIIEDKPEKTVNPWLTTVAVMTATFINAQHVTSKSVIEKEFFYLTVQSNGMKNFISVCP